MQTIKVADLPAEVSAAFDKAKIQLMNDTKSAFFTTVFFNLKQLWSEDVPTAATNGLDIVYNPNYYGSLDKAEQLFLMLHETYHVALKHSIRGAGREPEIWNKACDHAINLMLKDAGYTMPKGGLADRRFEGMSAEEIYNVLLQDPEDQGHGSGGYVGDLMPPKGDQDGQDDPNQGQNQDGPGNDPTGQQEQPTPQQISDQVDDILVKAKVQTEMSGKDPGSLPGEIQIYLDKLLKPRLPWNVILRRFMNRLIKRDYSFRKPNRRFFSQNIIMPTAASEGLGHISVIVDTSCSVTDQQFTEFLTETDQIMRTLKPEVLSFVQFDTSIKADDKVRSYRDLAKLKFTGRGGTRITPVIEWINENRPLATVIFTDGYFEQPPFDPGVPVIWVIHSNRHGFDAPFGQVIEYNFDD